MDKSKLSDIAKQMMNKPKGILAMDESRQQLQRGWHL